MRRRQEPVTEGVDKAGVTRPRRRRGSGSPAIFRAGTRAALAITFASTDARKGKIISRATAQCCLLIFAYQTQG